MLKLLSITVTKERKSYVQVLIEDPNDPNFKLDHIITKFAIGKLHSFYQAIKHDLDEIAYIATENGCKLTKLYLKTQDIKNFVLF